MTKREPSRSATAEPLSTRTRFRRTLLKVLAVQAIALLALWLLQARYGG